MKNITCIIIEDVTHSLDTMKRVINENLSNISIVGTTGYADEAISLIKKHRPDILLLDIELHDGKTGFDILEELQKDSISDFLTIFISSYHTYEYAKEAITYTDLEFVEKPIDKEVLIKTFEKAISNIEHINQKEQIEYLLEAVLNQKNQFNKIAISEIIPGKTSKTVFIDPAEIIYYQTESAGSNWTNWFLVGGRKIRSDKPLKEYQTRLDLDVLGFYRIHQSTVINKKHLLEYYKKHKITNNKGEVKEKSCVLMAGNILLEVTGSYKSPLFSTKQINSSNWIQNILNKLKNKS